MYDTVEATIRQEIKRQERILKEHTSFIDSAPEGHLNARNRKAGVRYYCRYRYKKSGQVYDKEVSLQDNPKLLNVLTQKAISVEIIMRCEKNLKVLKQMLRKYESIDIRDVAEALDPRFLPLIDDKNYYMAHDWLQGSYLKNPDPYGNNVHLSARGDLVASKTEVIIADKLFHYGIPYRHDCAFPVPYSPGMYYYPDFTIELPNGELIWWEHLGLMSNVNYAEHTGEKLAHYHNNGAVIGRNLILTADDRHGGCDSGAIDRIIKDYILPHFQVA